jgi:cystathionine beta-lyase
MPDPSPIADWDALTAHDLRSQGSLKWTRFDGDTIGAFVAEMDFGTAPAITTALQQAVSLGNFGYLPPWLAAELAQACARWQQQRYGWPVAPEQIYPVSDVLTAFELALRHFSRPGSPVILPTPAYMPFLSTPQLSGRAVIEVPMAADGGRYVFDLDALAAAFRAGGHLLVLCNPANPVGRVFDAGELAAVTELVDRYGGRVFADEVHAPLTYPGYPHLPYAATSAAAARHSLTAVSASKAWNLPGLRCAQVIISPDDQPAWQRVGTVASVLASTLGTVAAAAAYRSGESWLRVVLGYLDRNRQRLAELLASHLPQVRYRLPEGTYLAWLDCRELPLPGDRPDLGELFRRQAGVALVDGAECGEAGRGFVRLNIATPLPILERIVTRMAHAVGRSG